MNEKEFITELKKLNIEVTPLMLERLEKYYNLLIEYNQKINLTRITEKQDVYLKHFYDSITLIKAIDLNQNLKVCDIGTGAGFPGLVLKIVFPNLQITLVDALNKRINFLNIVIKELNLKNINTVHDRAEIFIRKNNETYDLITCRAVSKLNIISELCIPGLKINGYFIPMKANIDEEIKNTKYLQTLGAKIENIITFKLPKQDINRNLIIIKKIRKTIINIHQNQHPSSKPPIKQSIKIRI